MDKSKLQANVKSKMDKVLDNLDKDLQKYNTGRAKPSIVEPIRVEAYGDMMPLSQLANVTVSDSTNLLIQVWDKTMVKPIEKAIANCGLGFTASAEGSTIRIIIPPLSESRRKDLVKQAKSAGENNKIAIRNIRRDIKDEFKELGLGEDVIYSFEEEIQKITEEYNGKIDKIILAKTEEIMKI